MSKSNKRQERTVKYAYLRDERDPRRVMTIARRWGKNGNKMHYAYTICNPVEDQFRKASGRDEATRRMEVNPTKIRPEQGEFVLSAIIENIATRDMSEDRARNAIAMANQWLEENDRRMEEDYLSRCEQDDNDFEGICDDSSCSCHDDDEEAPLRGQDGHNVESDGCGGCDCVAGAGCSERDAGNCEHHADEANKDSNGS